MGRNYNRRGKTVEVIIDKIEFNATVVVCIEQARAMEPDRHDWHLTARYLYTLPLDGPGWAWEWLRRNPRYRDDYARLLCNRRRRRGTPQDRRRLPRDCADRWGLSVLEAPDLSALEALVCWRRDWFKGTLRVGAQRRPSPSTPPFTLWSERGRKAIFVGIESAHVILQSDGAGHRLVFEDRSDLSAQIDLELRIDAMKTDRSQFEAARRFLFERYHEIAPQRPLHPRAPRMMQMLQVIDGRAAGASQREVAEVLFGAEAVAEEWRSSDRLKSRVRYLEQRGSFFINGGYRTLLGPSDRSARGTPPIIR